MTAILKLLSRRGEPSQAVRRATVVLALIVIPALPATLFLSSREHWPHPAGLLVFIVGVAAYSVPLLVLQEFRRNVMRRSSADERERTRRDQAYRISYRIVEYAMPVGLLALLWFQDAMAATVSSNAGLLFLAIFGYVIFLPYAVFAWREPDAAD